MFRFCKVTATSLLLLVFSVNLLGQTKPITNDDLIVMLKAGLTEDTILLSIERSPTAFDASPKELVRLKGNGATPKILEFVINSKNTPASARPASAVGSSKKLVSEPQSIRPNGVYLVDSENSLQLRQSIPTVATKKKWHEALSLGVTGRGKVSQTIRGNESSVRVSDRAPNFFVSLPTNLNAVDTLVLCKLEKLKNRREIKTVDTGSSLDINSTIVVTFDDEDVMTTNIEELRTETTSGESFTIYRISPSRELDPGEYALIVREKVGTGLAFYDFAID